jgi:hypothetical protein
MGEQLLHRLAAVAPRDNGVARSGHAADRVAASAAEAHACMKIVAFSRTRVGAQRRSEALFR